LIKTVITKVIYQENHKTKEEKSQLLKTNLTKTDQLPSQGKIYLRIMVPLTLWIKVGSPIQLLNSLMGRKKNFKKRYHEVIPQFLTNGKHHSKILKFRNQF